MHTYIYTKTKKQKKPENLKNENLTKQKLFQKLLTPQPKSIFCHY